MPDKDPETAETERLCIFFLLKTNKKNIFTLFCQICLWMLLLSWGTHTHMRIYKYIYINKCGQSSRPPHWETV